MINFMPVASEYLVNLGRLLYMFFGFLPTWAIVVIASAFALFVAVLVLRLLLFLKDLLWPF